MDNYKRYFNAKLPFTNVQPIQAVAGSEEASVVLESYKLQATSVSDKLELTSYKLQKGDDGLGGSKRRAARRAAQGRDGRATRRA